MNIVGVVAEFNPFHNGHKYQLDELVKRLNPDIKIALISSNYVQRAELSILDVYDRTKIALDMGYDIVIEIPSIVSFQNAEIYSSYSTRMLDKINSNIQVFGAETDNLEKIYKMIELLNDDSIIEYMKKGISYNKACSLILEEKGLFDVYKSNNILAMEYVRAIKNYELNIKPYIIKRINVDYNSLNVKDKIASATNIRKKIYLNEDISELVPYKKKYEYILNYKDKLFELFKYIVKSHGIDDIYDINEQLKNYILNRIDKANTYDEFIILSENKNISINRIKRSILNVVLNIKNKDIEDIKKEEIKEIKVLGINKKGAKYIKNFPFMKVNYKDLTTDKKYTALYNYLGFKDRYTNVIYKKENEDVFK